MKCSAASLVGTLDTSSFVFRLTYYAAEFGPRFDQSTYFNRSFKRKLHFRYPEDAT